MGFNPQKQWQVSAIADLQEGKLTVPEVAVKYGKQRDTIYRLARAAKIQLPPRQRGFRSVANASALSKEHRLLGVYFTLRADHLSPDDLSVTIGISKSNITRLRAGQYDPTLSELLRIAEICKCSIEELMHRPKLKAVQ